MGDDDATKPEQRSRFEWRPEDVTILNPGDEGYDDDEFEDEVEVEVEEEPTSASTIEGTEPGTVDGS